MKKWQESSRSKQLFQVSILNVFVFKFYVYIQLAKGFLPIYFKWVVKESELRPRLKQKKKQLCLKSRRLQKSLCNSIFFKRKSDKWNKIKQQVKQLQI